MHIEITDPVTDYFRITPVQKDALRKMGIHNIRDLLYHFPAHYGDTAEARTIDSLSKGDNVVIYGKIVSLQASKGFKTKVTMADGVIEDDTGRIRCIWFNQPYIAKMYTPGLTVRIEGKVSEKRKKPPIPNGTFATANATTATTPSASVTTPNTTTEASPTTPPPEVTSNIPSSNTPATLYFSNPKIEHIEKLPTGVGDSLFGKDGESHTLYPVYPESRGVSSLWIYHAILKLFKNGILDVIPEIIPEDILQKYNLPGIKTAIIWMHSPKKNDDALAARKRFAFEEIFTIQLGKQQARKEYENYPAFTIEPKDQEVNEFVKRFPFQATQAQNRAITTIIDDMKRGYAMSRLLEGDVGSGKTAVAAATAYAVVTWRPELQIKDNDAKKSTEEIKSTSVGSQQNKSQSSEKEPSSEDLQKVKKLSLPPLPASARLQVAYMCPTEILATQHFESFIQYFAYLGIQIGLMTSSGCRKFPSKVNPKGWTDISRTQLLTWVANGEIPIVIGTHSLIQKAVKFKYLAYVIIDEQHRFGTAQRAQLVKKNQTITKIDNTPPAPHLLSMTATPIPRTLALTLYGDLDLTLLDQSPAGRKPIITLIVPPTDRDKVYEKVRQELEDGRQVYVICPRIDEPDPDKELALNAKSVKEEAKRLKERVFQEYNIGILHSRMKPAEKDSAMMDFKSGKTHILCATSVVEVGVNVPNATVILIEGAERFGLAQLHQLRGRVLRSSNQAYCFAFTETTSAKSIERLKALSTAKNGFELAELDLAQRGSGQLSGIKQWGVSDIAMEALKNLKMVEAARNEAYSMIKADPELNTFPLLKKVVAEHNKESHFE